MQSNDTTPTDNRIVSKRCSKCERELPLMGFYKDKNKSDGRMGICKQCQKDSGQKYRQENRDAISDRDRQYRQKNKERIAEYGRQYHQKNRDKIRDHKRRYQQENKDAISERGRRYRQRNKLEVSKRHRQYYQDNRGKFAEYSRRYFKEHKEGIAEYKRRHREENKDKYAVYSQNRRARERANGGNITAAEWRTVLDRFNGKCAKCGSAENIHMDHVVPLAKGGRHDVSNVQPLCATCNIRKGVKIEDYRGKFYKPAALPLDDAA